MKRLYMDHVRARRFKGGQQVRGINLSDPDFERLDSLAKKGMRSALLGFAVRLFDLVTPDTEDRDEERWTDELKTYALLLQSALTSGFRDGRGRCRQTARALRTLADILDPEGNRWRRCLDEARELVESGQAQTADGREVLVSLLSLGLDDEGSESWS